MSSLFDKLSTLLNAQVNDLMGRNPKSPLARIRLNPEEAEKDPRRSAQTLRQRLEEAIDYEGELEGKINSLTNEALDLDAEIDVCLRGGDQFGARRLQGQLNMKQQQITIAESELRDHRMVTRHLMQEMSTLESALDSRERQGSSQATRGESRPRSTKIPVEGVAAAADSLVGSVAGKLDEARDSIETLLSRPPTADPPVRSGNKERIVIVDEEPDPRQPKPRKKDQENMSRRLSRLSKPAEDDG
ncbi:MAG: hypothetical protein OXG78_11865 [Chloroflexi bacterium]|nr:hypothetical protein [Chloroflexota bacterium]